MSIANDGKGMTSDEVKGLLSGERSEDAGIGLRNIDRRLKQLYNEGLIIESSPDGGTTVKFKIPVAVTE